MVNDAYKVLFGRDDDNQKYSFSESDHPRADDGKFSSKGGGSDKTPKLANNSMYTTIGSKRIQVSRYKSKKMAMDARYTAHDGIRDVFHGDDGTFWVVPKSATSYMIKNGYTLVDE